MLFLVNALLKEYILGWYYASSEIISKGSGRFRAWVEERVARSCAGTFEKLIGRDTAGSAPQCGSGLPGFGAVGVMGDYLAMNGLLWSNVGENERKAGASEQRDQAKSSEKLGETVRKDGRLTLLGHEI